MMMPPGGFPGMMPQGVAPAQAPMIVLNPGTQREQGHKAQIANIKATKAVADIVRTTLGPKSMLKMLIDPMGGIVLTNDGNAILREVEVQHPAAKSIIEISRAQEEEVGDGTTSVVVLAGEFLQVAEPFIERNIHPTVIVNAYFEALDIAMGELNSIAHPVDPTDQAVITNIVKNCIGTKFVSKWGDMICELAIQACKKVIREKDGHVEIDTKRYAKVEKIPGGTLDDCCVLDGVILNKDVTHPEMKREIVNPRVILVDCPLEYKKGESATNMEFYKEEDFKKALKQEEQEVKLMCDNILKFKPDLVIGEKGVADLATHYFLKQGVSVLRRVKKTDNNRIARVTGATIVNRPEEITEADVGTQCGKFEIRKIGDDFFAYLIECRNPKACSIILRGASKDVLNEIERNFDDAIQVARNISLNPKLVPGGGAVEMELAARLNNRAQAIKGVKQWPFKALASAFEVIPRTLAQNCGGEVVRLLTQLRAKHAQPDGDNYGIDGTTGKIVDVSSIGIWDPVSVKMQTIKSALEVCCMLLRIDDVVSGLKKEKQKPSQMQPQPGQGGPDEETFGDARDG